METLKGPRRWFLLLDYSNQGGWGMSVSLKECNFEDTKLSIHFESFNDVCAKKDKSVEPGIKTIAC